MSDDTNPEPEDGEETGTEGTAVERTATREEAATLLHDLADGVASGTVAFEDGQATAAVPEPLHFELEYEREGDEAEIEVELGWDVDAPEATDEVESEEAKNSGGASAVEGLVEPGEAARSRARFELYRDSADEWRWRLVHHNGNIIADGGEGYNRKGSARNGLESVRRNAPGAAVVERE